MTKMEMIAMAQPITWICMSLGGITEVMMDEKAPAVYTVRRM